MNNLVNAFNNATNKTATTDNGALAYKSSLSANLDFFYLAGASRGKDISNEFLKALREDEDIALRILQWLRDVRGGAGERSLFRNLVKITSENIGTNAKLNKALCSVIAKVPEIGRFDDLIFFIENLETGPFAALAEAIYVEALKSNNGLAFKWAPIKGDTAKNLRKLLGYKNEAAWRKYIVAGRKTVEQQMCAKDWCNIEFSKVPSVASARYQKAFGRNATEKYVEYLESLKKGETNINASAVYPYDIYRSCFHGNAEVAEQQWKALPNYLEGTKERILPVIDVSGSMGCPAGGSKTLSCMDVAISLGVYIAQKQEGAFKNVFMTFHTTPEMLQFSDKHTLKEIFTRVRSAPWGGTTDLVNTFYVLLRAACSAQVKQEDMPTTIVVLSDMQFNPLNMNMRDVTAMEYIQDTYKKYGYDIPKLVFWNLNASNKSIPVTKHETGVAMVSGFSPSLMKGILSGCNNPEQVMLDTVMIDRYKL